VRFLLLLAAAAAFLIIFTVVGLATGSAIAGFLTATVALVLCSSPTCFWCGA
jgi:hypothetical protein